MMCAEGESLRKLLSAAAMSQPDCFDSSAAIAFITSREMARQRVTHDDDLECLQALSEEAGRALDRIRFDYCRFDLPGTLPGAAGTWSESNAYCCAILFDAASQKAELIAGEALFHSVVSNWARIRASIVPVRDRGYTSFSGGRGGWWHRSTFSASVF